MKQQLLSFGRRSSSALAREGCPDPRFSEDGLEVEDANAVVVLPLQLAVKKKREEDERVGREVGIGEDYKREG